MNFPFRIAPLVALGMVAEALPAQAAPPDFSTEKLKSELGPLWEYTMARCAEFGWTSIAFLFLAFIAVTLLTTWGVSRWITWDTGTLKNAFLYHLLGLLSSCLIAGIAVALGAVAYSSGSMSLLIGTVVLVGIALIVVGFLIPMRLYQIGVLRALCFNLLVALAGGLAQGALEAVLPGPLDELAGKSDVEQKKIVSDWYRKQRGKEFAAQYAAQPSAPMALTPAQRLRQMHDLLRLERARLNVEDKAAVRAFNQRVAEYNAFRAHFTGVPVSVAVSSR